jgi:imidazolonepropionase-like amidohydrolase
MVNGARTLAPAGQAGEVQAGMLADLVILDADPLADIGNPAKVHRTIKGGEVFDPEELMANLGPATTGSGTTPAN